MRELKLGPDYIIPKAFDPRVLLWVAVAVAKAAMESGVAQTPVNLRDYRKYLQGRLDHITNHHLVEDPEPELV